MNRLEKKCLLGSAATHALLVVIFLFGTAFLSKRVKDETPPVFEIVPYNPKAYTDDKSSGGNRFATPPAASKPAPVAQPPAPLPPQPKPEKVVEPPKPKEKAQPKQPDPKELGDVPDPVKKPDLRRLTNTVVKTRSEDLAKARAEQERKERAERAERAQAERAQRLTALAGVVGKLATGLDRDLSGKVAALDYGPGTGGPAMANWRSAVVALYQRAWDRDRPHDAGGSASVMTSISFARDGTVLNWQITKPSGDSSIDRAVERILRNVISVPAFPDTAKEDRRTINISFDLNLTRTL